MFNFLEELRAGKIGFEIFRPLINPYSLFFITEWEEEIPFVNAAPIDEEEAKKQKKQQKSKKDKE